MEAMSDMIDAVFWWVGLATCTAFGLALAWLLMLVARDAVISVWHLGRFYSFGPIWRADLPFRLFWYFFWHSPRYVIRRDQNAIVYRPGKRPLPDDPL